MRTRSKVGIGCLVLALLLTGLVSASVLAAGEEVWTRQSNAGDSDAFVRRYKG